MKYSGIVHFYKSTFTNCKSGPKKNVKVDRPLLHESPLLQIGEVHYSDWFKGVHHDLNDGQIQLKLAGVLNLECRTKFWPLELCPIKTENFQVFSRISILRPKLLESAGKTTP